MISLICELSELFLWKIMTYIWFGSSNKRFVGILLLSGYNSPPQEDICWSTSVDAQVDMHSCGFQHEV